ncbi:hypothetical protein V9T40_000323 [Parthenolecanium corni]|uniref:Uncharacterized protein n=1 Tax=Parthenolecanium corni TaxID=536013 RepID=A0AAN9TAY8_9HEMI
MMPIASTAMVALPSKPKIGFSIDSIVGDGHEKCASPSRSETELSGGSLSGPESSPCSPMSADERRSSPASLRRSSASLSPPLDPGSVSPPHPAASHASIVRPSALAPQFSSKGLYVPEPAVAAAALSMHHNNHHHHHHQLALAAAAAQHFQAAGLAAALGNPFLPANGQVANGHTHPSATAAHNLSASHPHSHPPRDTYPLYPWLLSRHGRIFPHRFPGDLFDLPPKIYVWVCPEHRNPSPESDENFLPRVSPYDVTESNRKPN